MNPAQKQFCFEPHGIKSKFLSVTMTLRTSSRTSAVIAAAMCALTSPAFSQPVITSFSQNGLLVCSKLAPGSVAAVEAASSLAGVGQTNWQDLESAIVGQDGTVQVTVPVSQAPTPMFYRVRGTGWPTDMALIPAGSFEMGDNLDGSSYALPLHSVYVSAFYMDRYEVTKALWDDVYNWAITNGYSFDHEARGKTNNHPAHSMIWYNAVKWCNARSEKEGITPAYYKDTGLSTRYRSGYTAPYVNWNSGYRLPTEAEWEKAARGGAAGRRFPWTDTDNITHSRANYYSSTSYSYDTSSTRGYHPTFNDGTNPYTSPVGYFAPNGYGLYDMAGNVWEWCWDWYGSYTSASETDPRGPQEGSDRVRRGGGWSINFGAIDCRTTGRSNFAPGNSSTLIGFRAVLPPGQ